MSFVSSYGYLPGKLAVWLQKQKRLRKCQVGLDILNDSLIKTLKTHTGIWETKVVFRK